MQQDQGSWHRTIWKLLSNPGMEVVATLAVVMVATWYLIQAGPADPLAAVPLFGRR